jgi:hypothetical protein
MLPQHFEKKIDAVYIRRRPACRMLALPQSRGNVERLLPGSASYWVALFASPPRARKEAPPQVRSIGIGRAWPSSWLGYP